MMTVYGFTQVSPISNVDLEEILDLFNRNAFNKECALLGYGGSANVFLYKGIRKNYAVKVFHKPSQQEYPEPLIWNELQGLPCIPTMYGYIPNKLMIVDYIDGQDLRSPVPYSLKSNWEKTVESSLSSIYQKGYMPYDLEEDNIMVDTFGNVWFIDLGGFVKQEDDFYIKMIKNNTLYYIEESIS